MADYKGKLSGKQIDELPDKISELSLKVGEMTEENFVEDNDVYIGGAYTDEEGNLHMPTAEYNEANETITIK